MKRFRMTNLARTLLLLMLVGISCSLSACDPAYGGVVNNYQEPVAVTLLSDDSRIPSRDITLAASQGFVYRFPTKLLGITVRTRDGKAKTYNSDAIETLAASIHEPNEMIQWAVYPDGLYPRCVHHWLVPACIH